MTANFLSLPSDVLERVADAALPDVYTYGRPYGNNYAQIHSLIATCKVLQELGAASQKAFFALIMRRHNFPCLGTMMLTRVERARLCCALNLWQKNRMYEREMRTYINIVGWSFEARQLVDPTTVSLLARVKRDNGEIMASAVLPWQPKMADYVGVNAATGKAGFTSTSYYLERAQFTTCEDARPSVSTPVLFPEALALQAGCDFDRGEAMEYMHARQTAVEDELKKDSNEHSFGTLEVEALVISWHAVPGSEHRALRWAPLIHDCPLRATDVPFDDCGCEHCQHAPHESQFSLSEERVLSWYVRAPFQLRKLDENGKWEGDPEKHVDDPEVDETLTGHASDGANYGDGSNVHRTTFIGDNWLDLSLEFKTRLQRDDQRDDAIGQLHILDGLRLEFVYQMGGSLLRRSARRQPPPHPLNLLLNRLAWRASNDGDDQAASPYS